MELSEGALGARLDEPLPSPWTSGKEGPEREAAGQDGQEEGPGSLGGGQTAEPGVEHPEYPPTRQGFML